MKKGIKYSSRRQSNFLKILSPKNREEFLQYEIVQMHIKDLLPLVKITGHDKHFREVKYEINVPDKGNENG